MLSRSLHPLSVSVAIAEGKHPVPFRTRKLSPPAPMVLPWRRGGRVGRCRNIFSTRPRRGLVAFWATLSFVGTRPGGARHGSGRKGPVSRSPRVHGPLPRDVVDDVRATARGGRANEPIKRLEKAVSVLPRDPAKAAVKAAAQAKALAP